MCGWDDGREKLFRRRLVVTRYSVILLALCVGSQFGCQTMYVDTLSLFFIDARVISQDGAPLDGVEIRFVDTGLDTVRSREAVERLIGHTDKGELRKEFAYTWGCCLRTGTLTRPRCHPAGTFLLRFRKPGFEAFDREFSIHSLPRRRNAYELTIDVLLNGTRLSTASTVGKIGSISAS